VAIVARIDPGSGSPVRAGGEERSHALDEAMARAGTTRSGSGLWRIRGNAAELIVPATESRDEREQAKTLQAELRAFLGPAGESALSLGVGTVREGLAGIRRSHAEARQALLLGRRLHGPGRLTVFADLGVYRLIFAAEKLPELSELYRQSLGALIAYDRQNNGGLVSTLDAFFAANGSPKEAAERLGVHRNTVLYRLDRIREITGDNLDDAGVRLRLQLALHVHLALGDALSVTF
jgi:DNA-binding PucR family transcriptional regulator